MPDPPQKVSRPPTASSFSKKPPSEKPGEIPVDDDLPPRMETSTPPPEGGSQPPAEKAAAATPPTPAESGSQDLPLRAGFDLDAIKKMIGNSEVKDADMRAPPALPPVPVSPVPPPSQRSASMPLSYPSSSSRSPSPPTPPAQNPPPPPLDAAQLTSPFTRSMSLNEHHSVSITPGPAPSPFSPPIAPTMRTRPLLSPSAMSLSEGLWSTAHLAGPLSSRSPTDLFPAAGHASPLMAQTSSNLSSILTPTANGDLYADLFTPSGLSFGGPDGLVTSPPAVDPWSARSDEKKTYSFNANPWS